ncbi:MAG: hypothetical protein ABIG03_05835 [Candidatus Eisenbacteria bacterium]
MFRILAVSLLLICSAPSVGAGDGARAAGHAAAPRAGPAVVPGSGDGQSFDLAALLRAYNDGVERALACVESLRVEQVIFEPQSDGSTKRAEAVLSYSRDGGMEREVGLSEISHLVGRYTLMSLVGPVIDTAEYEVEYLGLESKEDRVCHRLGLTAIVRDADHFDGTVWVSVEAPGPVRIVGTVADPPFPAVRVTLDKAFLPGPGGICFVRRHTGEAVVKLLVTRQGTRHIFYDGYEVTLGDDAAVRGGPAPSRSGS